MLNKKLSKIRRNFFELRGSDIYSRPALYDIDRKLEKYLTKKNGFFIEVGANDGFKQSNTYYLERFRGWTGILIEGIPQLYKQCLMERPNSRVFQYALVSDDFKEPYVTMKYGDLMSVVKGNWSIDKEENHINQAIKKQNNINPYDIKVPTITLTSILDKCEVNEIDFFSLDVEGYELNILKGLDFNKYRPKYILTEALEQKDRDAIKQYLSDWYVKIDQFSYRDILYELK